MSGIDRRPTSLGRALSASAAVLAVVASGYYSWHALVVATLGAVLVAIGLLLGSHRAVTVGSFGLVAAALFAGVQGAPVLPVLGSVVLAVIAWDVGGYAITIGDQLGREADTHRVEAVHAAATAGVGGLAATAGYAIYLVGTGNQPVAALLFLVLAAVLLVEAFA